MKRSLPVAAAAAVILAACGGSSYGREDAVEAMIDEAGFPPAFAECVADGAEEHGIPWDATDDSLNDEGGEHFDDMQAILIDCDAALDDDGGDTTTTATTDDATDDVDDEDGPDDATDDDAAGGGDDPADDGQSDED